MKCSAKNEGETMKQKEIEAIAAASVKAYRKGFYHGRVEGQQHQRSVDRELYQGMRAEKASALNDAATARAELIKAKAELAKLKAEKEGLARAKAAQAEGTE